MKDVIGWLILGTVLVFVGICGILQPLDDRITSLVGPYLMVPVGLTLLAHGALPLLTTIESQPLQRFAALIAYPAMTLGVALFLTRWMISNTLLRAAISVGVLSFGILLRKTADE